MSNLETQYVTVEANVTLARVAIPSDADTTSGYYITYLVATEANGGGFSGQSWLLEDPGNPFQGLIFHCMYHQYQIISMKIL